MENFDTGLPLIIYQPLLEKCLILEEAIINPGSGFVKREPGMI